MQEQNLAWFVGYLARFAHKEIYTINPFKFLPGSDLETEFSKYL